MARRMTLTICLLGGCVWCFALVSQVDSAQPASGHSPFKPVATVHSLMEGQGLVFKQIHSALTNPRTSKRSEQITAFSEVLAELANVNALNSDKEDYRGWAGQLRQTALELAAEAKKEKNADDERMNTLLARLKNTCTACHDVYQ